MEVVDDGMWNRVPMAPGPIDRKYFEAASQGKLIIQKCRRCENTQFPPKMLCVSCGEEPDWVETSGEGKIYTFTVVRRHGVEPFSTLVPFVLAMIDIPEGARFMGNITEIDIETVHVGQKVEAYSLRIDETMALPLWRPIQSS
tara:strand:+ start:827 stop:1255 length:429 start_codon:yes stop_codon:yes gene_type:complete